MSLQQVEEFKSDFCSEYDVQLQHLVKQFEDVTNEFTGLPPSRGRLDHEVWLQYELR